MIAYTLCSDPRRRAIRLLILGWLLAPIPSGLDIGWFFALLPFAAMAALTIATPIWLRQLDREQWEEEWADAAAWAQYQADLIAEAIERRRAG